MKKLTFQKAQTSERAGTLEVEPDVPNHPAPQLDRAEHAARDVGEREQNAEATTLEGYILKQRCQRRTECARLSEKRTHSYESIGNIKIFKASGGRKESPSDARWCVLKY